MTDSMTPEQGGDAERALADARAAVLHEAGQHWYLVGHCRGTLAECSHVKAKLDALIEAAQRVARATMPCEYRSEAWRDCEYETAQVGKWMGDFTNPIPCRSCEARATPVERDQREST